MTSWWGLTSILFMLENKYLNASARLWPVLTLKLLVEMPMLEVYYWIARSCKCSVSSCAVCHSPTGGLLFYSISNLHLIHMSECFIIFYAHHKASLNKPCKEVKKTHLSPFAVFWVGNNYSFPPTLRLKLYPIAGNTGDSMTAPSAFSSNSCIAGDK